MLPENVPANASQGRKFLQEKSPSYMTARSAHTALENITRGLVRTTLPRLPPAPGFEGYEEYMEQVKLWKKWIAWEKDDPLVLKQDEPEAYRQRVLYCYKQALMALRFWPEMWVDAARWCFENGISKDGKDVGLEFLVEGIKANPESVLLALSHGDRIESTFPMEEGDEAKVLRGNAVRAPYNKVLDTLYDMTKSLKDREKAEIARIEASAPVRASPVAPENDDEDAENSDKAEEKAKQDKIKLVQQGFAVQTQLLSRTISFVWIALIRAMRRIQGKGKPNNPLGGARHVFSEARQRGRLTSDVYVAVAQLEWNVYRDPVGTKIFERGAKLFPEDEFFMLEYLKHLHSIHDTTSKWQTASMCAGRCLDANHLLDARVVFETCVNRLVQKPENVHKAKVLYKYFHRYESHYGELSQIKKLEDRMAELFPDDPKLATFSARFSSDSFDPIAARLIVSPAVQMRPKLLVQSIEQAPSASESPRPQLRQEQSPRTQFLRATSSPKRPLYADEDENLRPRKIARGESPLKGAAGRRLDQQRRSQGSSGAVSSQQPPPISRDITFLLSLIPSREAYNHHYFNPQAMVRLIRDTHIPDYSTWKATQAQSIRHDESRAGHARQPSAEYGRSYSRDSPAPAHIYQQRPASPYRGAAGPSAAPYRHSPLRPGSSGSYEPPASFQAPQYDGASGPPPAVGSWQPPPMPPQPQFGASATQPPFPYVGGPPPPPQQQPPPTYGRYPY